MRGRDKLPWVIYMTMTSFSDPERLVPNLAELWPPQGQWTETDYFSLPDANRIIELSDGEVLIMPPPSFRHQQILGNLFAIMRRFLELEKRGVVVMAPLAVRLWPGKIREPDLMVYLSEHRDRIGDQVSSVPDLIVEIISPSSRRIDRQEKYAEYAQANVAEYWLVDPDLETVELFVLSDQAYELLSKTDKAGSVSSNLLAGLQTACQEIFAA